jgi:DNA polymerase-3 subunit gamma/tau
VKSPLTAPATGQRDVEDMTRPASAAVRSENAREAVMPVDADSPRQDSPEATSAAGEDWSAIVDALALTGMVKQLAVHCVLERRDEQVIHLRLDEAHAHLGRDTMKQRLEQCLQEHFSDTLRLVLHVGSPSVETPAARQQRLQEQSLEAAEEAIRNDGAVRALQDAFDARIVPETIQPVGS